MRGKSGIRRPLASKLSMFAKLGKPPQRRLIRSLGLGLITGAADDDCSAIGTYAQAGAQLGYNALWTAPVTFPMMVMAVYLSGKLGQVTGQGLFGVLREQVPRWLIHCILVAVVVGNTIEAGADIGGMAAAMGVSGELYARWDGGAYAAMALLAALGGVILLVGRVWK